MASDFVSNLNVDVPAMLAAAGPYAPAMTAYITRTMSQFATAAQTPADVAQFVLQSLTASPMPFRVQTSDWAKQFVGTSLADLDGAAVNAVTRTWVGG